MYFRFILFVFICVNTIYSVREYTGKKIDRVLDTSSHYKNLAIQDDTNQSVDVPRKFSIMLLGGINLYIVPEGGNTTNLTGILQLYLYDYFSIYGILVVPTKEYSDEKHNIARFLPLRMGGGFNLYIWRYQQIDIFVGGSTGIEINFIQNPLKKVQSFFQPELGLQFHIWSFITLRISYGYHLSGIALANNQFIDNNHHSINVMLGIFL